MSTLTANPTRRFVVRGVNDDKDFCMCCGKQGLKRVVWIEDNETGDIRHFGTTCALSPVKGFPKDEIKKAVRAAEKAQDESERKAYWEAQRVETDAKLARKESLYAERGGVYAQKTSPLNGRVFNVPADPALMDACHREVFPEQYQKRA